MDDTYFDKIYLIKNSDYRDRKVIAENMGEALRKYREHLGYDVSYDFSPETIFSHITSCEYIGPYEEDDVIK